MIGKAYARKATDMKIEITKKMLIMLAVTFVIGYAGGVITEHIIHGIQENKPGGHSYHCAEACAE
jgi:hypothetical protein